MRIKLVDGTWKCAGNISMPDATSNYISIYPTDMTPDNTFTVLKKPSSDVNALEDNMLFPLLIYENNPYNILGMFDGVFWLGNLIDLASEDKTLYKDKTYIVFHNANKRGDSDYHVLEWY